MTDPNAPEQLSLDIEYPTYTEYTIKLAKGLMGDLEVVRTMVAKTVDDAYNLIESLRDMAENRDKVTWQDVEVDARGILYGLAPGGDVFEISVVPPLSEPLAS